MVKHAGVPDPRVRVNLSMLFHLLDLFVSVRSLERGVMAASSIELKLLQTKENGYFLSFLLNYQ